MSSKSKGGRNPAHLGSSNISPDPGTPSNNNPEGTNVGTRDEGEDAVIQEEGGEPPMPEVDTTFEDNYKFMQTTGFNKQQQQKQYDPRNITALHMG